MLPKQYNILGRRIKYINKRNAIGRLIVCTQRRSSDFYQILSNFSGPKEEHALYL